MTERVVSGSIEGIQQLDCEDHRGPHKKLSRNCPSITSKTFHREAERAPSRHQ
ncbi:unnamed protein product [Linum tenue]|uniref:Uncharacterized protein n=1 Tax=Linum tenue TaxID=586396 RepID=A0AAV0KWK6_9ROSI|nr:unnamed protein product [Linum tenue]